MKIEEAIKKAIEGGWRSESRFDYDALASSPSDEGFAQAVWRSVSEKHQLSDTLLDPAFWQSLGKAMGWEESVWDAITDDKPHWELRWHDFIDHLISGKSAESFFEALQ